MGNYEEVRVKLTSTQLNKLKPAAKNETGATLRITETNIEAEELPHELFLTTIQTTKIWNAFAKSKKTDVQLSNTQISKIIQTGEFLGSWLNKLGKKVVTGLAILFPTDNLSGLVSNIASNAINKF